MIRIKVLGLISLFFFFSACGFFNKIDKSGFQINKFYTYYLNEKHQISFFVAGDHFLAQKKKDCKTEIKGFNIKFNSVEIIDILITSNEPKLTGIVIIANDKKNFDKFIEDNNAKIDTLKNQILFSKNNIFGYYVKHLSLNQYCIFLGREKQDLLEFSFLEDEYYEKVKSLNYGDNPKSIITPNCMIDAIEHSMYTDSTINYIRPLTNLLNNSNYYKIDKWSYQQVLMTFGSRLSNFNEYSKSHNDYVYQNLTKSTLICDTDVSQFISRIIDTTKNEKIVIFNENHFNPNHRILISLLLQEYYNYGFRYLALEALWENSMDLKSRGFPISKSGFYFHDPVYGCLIRDALKLGFKLIDYDDYEIENEREINQAKNIYKKSFEIDSNAKVLCLSGGQHIDESQNSKIWMAGQLKKLFNIDPFTISQTKYFNENDNQFIILNSSNDVDLEIINSFSLENYKNYKKYNDINVPIILKKELTYAQKIVAHIYIEEEYSMFKSAIPIEVIVLSKDSKEIKLKLPKGNYLITLNTEYDSNVQSFQISVE